MSVDKDSAVVKLRQRRKETKDQTKEGEEEKKKKKFFEREGYDQSKHARRMGMAFGAATGTYNPYAAPRSDDDDDDEAPPVSNIVALSRALAAQKSSETT